MGDKLLGTIPTIHLQEEIRDFTRFLQTIATKAEDQDVPLLFSGAKLKVAVVLVARKETIERYWIKPYIKRVATSVKEGFETIYLSGWGERFVDAVKEIKNAVGKEYVNVLYKPYEYEVRNRVKGILVVCQSSLSYLSRQEELRREITAAMSEIIPEVKDGQVQVVAIARIKGQGTKIAVQAGPETYELNAVGACIGENGERVNQLRSRFPGEFITFVPWSENINELIINALSPLKDRNISEVVIDPKEFVATVKVISEEAYAKAVGKGGINVTLASELCGRVIYIPKPRPSLSSKTAEDELRAALEEVIPEIRRGEIEIVGIARTKWVDSKVIVRWRGDLRDTRPHHASHICRGEENERLQAILNRTRDEGMWIHDWSPDSAKQIVNCLYPLRPDEVRSVSLDEQAKIATIYLEENCRSRYWQNPHNIDLVERVTGWKIEVRENHS